MLGDYLKLSSFFREIREVSITNPAIKSWWVILAFIFTIGVLFGYKYNSLIHNQFSPIIIPQAAVSSGNVQGDKSNCLEYEFNSSDWTFNSYKGSDEQGYYCPRPSASYPFPLMWFNKRIAGDFERVTVSAEVMNKSNQTATGPLIVALGSKPNLWKIYAFEKNPQLVGFERAIFDSATTEVKLEREFPKELQWPVKYGTKIDLNIRPFQV